MGDFQCSTSGLFFYFCIKWVKGNKNLWHDFKLPKKVKINE